MPELLLVGSGKARRTPFGSACHDGDSKIASGQRTTKKRRRFSERKKKAPALIVSFIGNDASEFRTVSKRGEEEMRTRTILTSLAVFFAGFALCLAAAADPQMGTWKLNESKSKLIPGMAKNSTVVYAPAGADIKVTVDGVDKDGKPAHNEWTGKFDGKEYPVTGDPASDMRSYKKVNEKEVAIVVKKGGKVTMTGNVVLAADGKSRTLTIKGTDPSGKEITSVLVYEKQ
jgi:hypothetical protein